MYEERFLRRAIELSREALTKPGTEPFASVVVKDGEIVGEGLNHSRAHSDPTSHAEVEAIRDACRRLQTVDLTGCDLYTSCEPGSMCAATMHVTGIRTMYYAASLRQSRETTAKVDPRIRKPSNSDWVRSQVALTTHERKMPAEQHLDAEAVEIIAAWSAMHALPD